MNLRIVEEKRHHVFDLVASVVLPGPEDVTQSDFPENIEKVTS